MTATAAPFDQNHDAEKSAARRAAALARWQRQSKRVRFLRRALPAAMALLVLMMAGWIGARAVLSALNAAKGAAGVIHMTNARFHGRDGQGRSFVVGAKQAIRDGVDVNKVALIAPNFELAGDPGTAPRHMSGDSGTYLDDRKLLYMDGHVTFEDGKGAKFISDHAILNIDDGSVKGNSSVKGDSPLGHIEASSYSVDQHGEHVIFTGNVHGHFLTEQEQGQ